MNEPENNSDSTKPDPKSAIDAALKLVEEEKREHERQWLIEFFGVPAELNYEEGQAWVREEHAKRTKQMEERQKEVSDLYAELDRRRSERLLQIGIPKDQHNHFYIDVTDPRYDAVQKAGQQSKDEELAMLKVLGIEPRSPPTVADEASVRTEGNKSAPPEQPVVAPGCLENAHSTDFSSVMWNGTRYTFTANQAIVVRRLWEAFDQGTPELRAATLLSAIDDHDPPRRLSEVFRNSDAWNTMIIEGEKKRHIPAF